MAYDGLEVLMPAVEENPSELLKDGYHRLRHPEEYVDPFEATAFEARLRALQERKSPPFPSWKEIWRSLKEAWTEAGKAWDADRANRDATKGRQSDPTLQSR
jgi:hypothetical protein